MSLFAEISPSELSADHPVDFTRSIPPLPPAMASHLKAGLEQLARDPDLGLIARVAHPGGSAEDRQAAALWVTPRFRKPVAPDTVIVTNGTQSAILLLLEGLVGQGGLLLAESLSWGVVGHLARLAHVRLKGVPIDENGIIPEAFDALCRAERPKALYCNPTDHNPTTSMMPEARRLVIAEIARQHGVAIIEDDAIGLLHPDAPRPISALAPDVGWYVMGLTKCLAQGLRMAYIVGPSSSELERVIGLNLRLSYWVPSPITAAVVSRWMLDGTAARIAADIYEENKAREKLALAILKDADLVIKPAAMHVWLRLPQRIDRHAFIAELAGRGVLVRAAEMFSVDEAPPPNAVRLSLSSPLLRADVERGLRTIAGVLERSAEG